MTPIQFNSWTVFFYGVRYMKTKKLSLFKCIFIYFCCTLLFSSSIFVSYNTTVYASEAEWDDAARAGIWIAATIAGLFFVPEITAPIVIGALAETGVNAVTIGKYIYENSDGTYTISPEFVQAVMDAAKQLEEQGFSDSHVTAQGKGNLYIYKWTVTNTFTQNFNGKVYPGRRHIYNRSCELATRVAGFNEIVSNNSSTDYYHNVYQYKNGGINAVFGSGTYSFNNFQDEKVVSNLSSSTSDSLSLDGVNRYDGSSSFGGNFPIFSTRDAMNEYLRTGKGYKDAENYRPTPIFRRHSSYTPTYSGGSITVNRTVIENISEKIAEVDARELLSDDEKIELLQQYILTGKLDGGTGGGNTDYEDNKDVPAGTDLADTNSWLKKIYLKVCQIYDRMNSAVEDAEQTALAKMQESLDEIIVQLKKIKRWTAIDTVVDGVDAIGDWLDLIRDVLKDAKEGAGSAVASLSSAVGDSVDLMSKKFPFSIPWDILFFVSALSAEPQVPHFEIPFNIELSALDITIDYTMELDFSQLQWLSDLSRLLLSMTYAVGLMKLTFGVTSVGKEE